MISLVMRRGPNPGEVYSLSADEITIGRGVRNAIVINDNGVSREHCRLVLIDEHYQIDDLHSADGTFVNGQRVVTPVPLRPGTLIELGETITLEYGVTDSQILTLPDYIKRLMPGGKTPEYGDSNDGTAPARYFLMMLEGPATGYTYSVEGDAITIGRDLSNDVVIQDPEVSRHHIRLTRTRRGFMVEDLNSTNGSFVNNAPLKEPRALIANDTLRLGSLVQLLLLRLEEDETIEEAAARAMPKYGSIGDTTIGLLATDVAANLSAISGIEPNSLRDTVMVVYARPDWRTAVAPLLIGLQDGGVPVWTEQYLTPGTDEWRAALAQALHETWLMVLVVSPRALELPAVRTMYTRFLRERKPVIAFVVDSGTPLPAELSRVRSIECSTSNAARSYHKLIFEIRQFWKQRST